MKSSQMEIIIPVYMLKVNLEDTFRKYTAINKLICVKHFNGDIRPHYHICLHFGGASVSTEQVAKWFQLGYFDENGVEHTGENFIKNIKCSWIDHFCYLDLGCNCSSKIVSFFDFDVGF